MGERRFNTQEEANSFARFMRGISGQEFSVAQEGTTWVVRTRLRSLSIVEVTEALLRQTRK